MAEPSSTKLSAHLTKFRYANARGPSAISPKRETSSDLEVKPILEEIAISPLGKRNRETEQPPETSRSPKRSAQGTPPNKRKVNRSYATPETYAHLKAVPDLLRPGLTVVFCGINPSITSSTKQAPYSHPSNRFWKALHGGGFTDRQYDPQECIWLPERFNIGMTNLVSRPTAEQAELSSKEMRRGSLELLHKIMEHRPGIVCFVGKKIWDEFEFVIKKSAKPARKPWVNESILSNAVDTQTSLVPIDEKPIKIPTKRAVSGRPPFQWDQPRPYRVAHGPPGEGIKNTLFWVVPSTSGLVRVQLPEQIEHFKALARMIDALKEDRVDYDMFREVDPDGVAATVAAIPE